MAYTLTNLQDDIRNYTEVDDSVLSNTILTTVIKNAENKYPKNTLFLGSKKFSLIISRY